MTSSFSREDVLGKTVIDSSGKVVGKVKDVVFSLDGAVTLTVQGEGGAEVQIPLGGVTGISEFVIVRADVVAQPSPSAPATVSDSGAAAAGKGVVACKFCGHEMARGAVWCPVCGRAQA